MKANIKLSESFKTQFGLDPHARSTTPRTLLIPQQREHVVEPHQEHLPEKQHHKYPQTQQEVVVVSAEPNNVVTSEPSNVLSAEINNPKREDSEKNEEYVEYLQKQIATLSVKYEQLKRLQKNVLEHLEDARAAHLEREVEVLNAKIPQRNLFTTYTCEEDRAALTACYQQHLNLKDKEGFSNVNILKCRPLLKKFTDCANQNRRQFLNNANL